MTTQAETAVHHFQDWDNRLDPGTFVVFCTCGYESRSFARVKDADADACEHYAEAHPA